MLRKRSDRELLEAWRQGDKAAGDQLFERYYDKVLKFFRNKVSTEVKDLVQQTFAACVEGRDRLEFKEDTSFRSYLFGVAHNLLRSHLRRRYRNDREVEFDKVSIQDLAPGPSSIIVKHREERLLLEALRRLPLEHQVMLELRFWEDMKTREIASVLEVPHATARTRLRRALQLLEQKLEELADSTALLASTRENLEKWASSIWKRMNGATPYMYGITPYSDITK